MSLLLPVQNDLRSHSFSMDLDGGVFVLGLEFNYRLNEWIMSISDANANPIVTGIAVQTNVDLISQYPMDSMPKGLIISIDETGQERNPDEETFGKDVKLVYMELDDFVD